jgi:hypothetical protein
MRMPLEEFGRSLMRVRANDHVGTHLIACIFDTTLRDFFGLAERSIKPLTSPTSLIDPHRPNNPSGNPQAIEFFVKSETRVFHHQLLNHMGRPQGRPVRVIIVKCQKAPTNQVSGI